MAGLRREYHWGKLEDSLRVKDPLPFFARWFDQALKQKDPNVNAMALATSSSSGVPSVRILLLKGFDRRGFCFYTHYESRKGREISKNSQGEIVFYWPSLERQVRIAGRVVKLSRAESCAYFSQRPRGAQLAAWASHQSRVAESRRILDQKYAALEKKFQGRKIPCPLYWGGYRLIPKTYEFWQGRKNRLNDRLLFTRKSRIWTAQRLQP